MFFVYIVECADGTFYTGYTNNLFKRLKDHNESRYGAKYTRSRRPVKLKYIAEFSNRSETMKKESEIKQLTRQDKELLCKIDLRSSLEEHLHCYL